MLTCLTGATCWDCLAHRLVCNWAAAPQPSIQGGGDITECEAGKGAPQARKQMPRVPARTRTPRAARVRFFRGAWGALWSNLPIEGGRGCRGLTPKLTCRTHSAGPVTEAHTLRCRCWRHRRSLGGKSLAPHAAVSHSARGRAVPRQAPGAWVTVICQVP